MASKAAAAATKGGGPGTTTQSGVKTTQTPVFGGRVTKRTPKAGRSGRR